MGNVDDDVDDFDDLKIDDHYTSGALDDIDDADDYSRSNDKPRVKEQTVKPMKPMEPMNENDQRLEQVLKDQMEMKEQHAEQMKAQAQQMKLLMDGMAAQMELMKSHTEQSKAEIEKLQSKVKQQDEGVLCKFDCGAFGTAENNGLCAKCLML